MGFLEDFATYLRTGIAARQAKGVERYSAWEIAWASWAITDEAAYVREGYRRNPTLYRGIELLASTCSTAELKGYLETAKGEESLRATDPLAQLLRRPSSDYDTQTRLIRQIIRRLYISGEFWAYKVPGERTGRVVDLQPLLSNKMRVKKPASEAGGRKSYLFYYDWAKEPVTLEPEQVLFIKFDDPMDPDRGLSPLAAAARSTDVANSVIESQKAFFDNGTIASGILTTDEKAPPSQLTEWAQSWADRYGGSKKAGKTPVLGGGLTYQRTGGLPGELAFGEIMGLSDSAMCSALGVPPILIGAKVGLDRATYSNYVQARSQLWEDTVAPLLKFIAEAFTNALVDEGDGKVCRFDTQGVPALQEDRNKKADRFRAALDAGAITVNEFRAALDLAPLADGEVYLRGPQRIPIPVGEGSTPLELPAPDGSAGESRDGARAALETPNGHRSSSALPAPATTHSGPPGGSTAQLLSARHQVRTPATSLRKDVALDLGADAAKIRRAMEGVFDAQLEAVVAGIPLLYGDEETVVLRDGSSISRSLRAASPFGYLVDVVVDSILNVAAEVARTAEAVRGHFRKILERFGESAAGSAWEGGALEVDAYAEEAAMRLGNSATQRTRELVRSALEEGLEAGEEKEALAERLEGVLADRSRAELIAATEAHRLAEAGRLLGWRSSGVAEVRWRTTSDDPCEFCRAPEASGPQPIDQAFAGLGDALDGADGGTMSVRYEDLEHPPLHPRCACELEVVS